VSGDANPIDRKPLVEWFGYEHDMHDAEIQTIQLLHPPEVSVVRMRAYRMTPEIDTRGYYVLDRHAIVSFNLEGLKDIRIENWEFCSILFNVEWEWSDGLHKLTLVSTMDGSETIFTAERITVSVEPIEA
jgi:hypothetical protein